MAESHHLSDFVSTVSKRFELTDSGPIMPDAAFDASCNEADAVGPEQREDVCAELLALAAKYKKAGSEETAHAVTQLFVIASFVLQNLLDAKQLFETQNVDLSNAAKFIDNQVKQRPVGTTPLTQGNNLFALLKSQKD